MNRLLPSSPAILAAAAFAAATGGCHRPSAPLAPPQVRWGEDVCTNCGMSLVDPRFAAAVVWRTAAETRPEHALFDDVGEVLAWNPPVAAEIRWYAGDHRTGKWIDATRAAYVRARGLRTPMGTGFAAFADRAAADAEAAGDGGERFDFWAARRAAAAHPYLIR